MFGLSSIATKVLNSIDNAAKETLEEPKISATSIRQRLGTNTNEDEEEEQEETEHEENGNISIEDRAAQNLLSNFDGADSVTTHVTSPAIRSSASNGTPIIKLAESTGGVPDTSSKTKDLPSASSSTTHEIEQYKKTIRKKNQDIEKLNRECLELEEQSSSLKIEVQEAWDNYKVAQEKAAINEAELQDELSQMKKSKTVDKHQLLQQIAKLTEEVSSGASRLQEAYEEKQHAQQEMLSVQEVNDEFHARLDALQDELSLAREGTVSGVQAMREELLHAKLQSEQMRQDHASLVRRNQERQEELERVNTELTSSLTKAQMELNRAKLDMRGGVERGVAGTSEGYQQDRAYVMMQQEIAKLTGAMEEEKERAAEKDRSIRQLDCEKQAVQIGLEDERRRTILVVDGMNTHITSLETQLRDLRKADSGPGASGGILSNFIRGGQQSSSSGSDASTDSEQGGSDRGRGDTSILLSDRDEGGAGHKGKLERDIIDLKGQNQHLSTLLLKKQNTMSELQAERSSLKARLADLQTRATKAEVKCAQLIDMENDDEYDDDYSLSLAYTPDLRSAGGLQRRSTSTAGSSQWGGGDSSMEAATPKKATRLMHDLESTIGLKPGPRVEKAVNAIDGWALLTGRFLRNYPLVRLLFVIYLMVLHLWVFVVLTMHAHSLESDTRKPPSHASLNP